MKKLFKIKTRIIAKDFDQTLVVGYIVAKDDNGVFDFINHRYRDGDWENWGGSMTREDIARAKGDFDDDDDLGEFYEQKYAWEEVGNIDKVELQLLRKLKMMLDPESE